MRSVLANDAALTQGGQQVGGAVEIWQLNIRGADPLGIVRVGANPGRNVELLTKFERRNIVLLVRNFCVENFDDVEVTACGQRLQHRTSEPGALGIEGVGRIHQTTLGSDTADYFGNWKDVWNPLREEEPDQLARRGPDFFAHDDAHAKVTLKRGVGRLDGMVVGDAHHV